MHSSGRPPGRSLSAIVGLMVLFCVAVPALGSASSQPAPVAHGHESVSALAAHVVVDSDHAHVGAGLPHCLVDSLADFLIPRLRGMLLALGLVLGLVVAWRLSAKAGTAEGRSPPRSAINAVSGPDLLTLFCVARR
ncbi:putative copper homeostasis (lipo)protein LpqS [Mycolicibacterium chlorophenolicum]